VIEDDTSRNSVDNERYKIGNKVGQKVGDSRISEGYGRGFSFSRVSFLTFVRLKESNE